MLIKDLNRVICHSCSEYIDNLSMTNQYFNAKNTCTKCINYKNGQCTKSSFNVIRDMISIR